jgi:hypothetical protein
VSTKVDQFIADLDGGVLEEKLSSILSDVAASVIDHGRAGTVQLTLNIKQIGNSHQVQIDHVLKYKRPTSRGNISEDNATTTPMYVGTRGALSFFPENQSQMFDKKGGVVDISKATEVK